MPIHHVRADTKMPLAEILGALSHALDLTEGRSRGHAQRTCLIGMRIAAQVGLPETDLNSLFHALLIKDVGCTSNAAHLYAIFGETEVDGKRAARVRNWEELFEAAKYVVDRTLSSHSHWMHLLLRLGLRPRPTTVQALHEARSARGSQIALGLGLGPETARCIQSLDEHWDGSGFPQHLQSQAIPLLARIACLAQTLEVFVSTYGVTLAYEVVQRRSGTWFDPQLVQAARSFQRESLFWRFVREAPCERVLALEAEAALEVATEERIDSICDAFAQVVDAKSPYTVEHSSRVCAYSTDIAITLGIGGERLATLRRAALLHDIGKLAVPTQTLNKAGRLTKWEWARMKSHPRHTEEILSQISGFGRLAMIAGAHHERLDGTGYFRGLRADQLDLDMRIIAVADVFDALLAARPYRCAMPLEQALLILTREADNGLDGRCVEALRHKYGTAGAPSLPLAAREHLLAT